MVSVGGPGFPIPFGRYVLLSSFGRGGMGEVFLAKTGTEGIERVCVLKTVRADHAGVEEYARRFLDEARVAVQLNHANICQVFDVGRVDDTLYLAMEYIPGVNVRDLLTRMAIKRKGLNPGLSLYFIEELLDALAYAHRQEHPLTGEDLAVVHRDISPHNVMVNFEGEVKLIDFGLAASSLKEENTESHLVMGKVAYMAPEQATGVHVDGRVDQFATGIMMYELLSGERYYGTMPTHEVWQIVGRGGHVPRKWDTIPAAVQMVISKALHPDYRQRFADCEAFRDEVSRLRAKLSPGMGKSQARALMQSIYSDRIEKQRTLLRSFASVPLSAEARGGSGPQPSAPRSAPSSQASADDPALVDQVLAAQTLTDLPDSADGAPASENLAPPPMTPEEPKTETMHSELSEQQMRFIQSGARIADDGGIAAAGERSANSGPSLTEVVRRPSSDGESAAVTPPPHRNRLIAAAVLLLIVAAGIGVWWAQRAPVETPVNARDATVAAVDAGAPKKVARAVQPVPHDAGAPPAIDAGAVVKVSAPPTRERKRPTRSRKGRKTTAPNKEPEPPPVVKEPEPPAPVKEPEPPPPVKEPPPPPPVEVKPPPPPKYSLAQNLAVVQRCSLACASRLRTLIEKKAPSAFKPRDKTVIEFCANACRKAK